jgi:hypothetical protein
VCRSDSSEVFGKWRLVEENADVFEINLLFFMISAHAGQGETIVPAKHMFYGN